MQTAITNTPTPPRYSQLVTSVPAAPACIVAAKNNPKLERWTHFHSLRGSRFIASDVTWTATSRYTATTPQATAEGRHSDANERVTERCDLWTAVASERGVEIRGHGADTGRVIASVVPGSVDQMLDNLIDNALSVSPEGSQIEVRLEPGQAHHTVRVIDSGPGMTPEQMERSFDRFWRGDTSRAGTGLGLAIVRRLAEASGGGAHLARAETGGVEATITVPAV